MQPENPTQALPIPRVNVGMTVADSEGEEVGRVTVVQMPEAGVGPGGAAGGAGGVMAAGSRGVAGTGFLSNALSAPGDQSAGAGGAAPATVTLNVPRSELFRPGS